MSKMIPEEDPVADWRGVQLHDRLLGVGVAQLGRLAGHLETITEPVITLETGTKFLSQKTLLPTSVNSI